LFIKKLVEKRLNDLKKYAASIGDEINHHETHLRELTNDLSELQNEIDELEEFLESPK
jgi:peptidoglycan hydrolase CwlO-like protein